MLTYFQDLQWMACPPDGAKGGLPFNVWNVAALLPQLIVDNPPEVKAPISVSEPLNVAKRFHTAGIEIM